MAEEQNIKEESTERIVALQTMYIKDVSFEAVSYTHRTLPTICSV